MIDRPRSGRPSAIAQIVRARYVLLALALVLGAAAVPVASQLEFDQRIESLYAADDPVLTNFLRSKELFGGDEFVLVAYEDTDLFEEGATQVSGPSRERLRTLTDALDAVPGVNPESTQNIARSLAFPYKRKRVRSMMEGVLVGTDGETANIILRLKPEAEVELSRAETIRRIREVGAEQSFDVFIVGEPVQIHDMFRYVEEDGSVLFLYSVVLLALVLFVFFRSIRWVLIAVLVVLITITWTEATLVLADTQLSMVSSMLNSLVTIVGVATVTHLTVRFQDKLQDLDPVEALEETLQELLPAIFWTCATTAVGFAALLSSSITPVRSFGLMMALSMLVVLVVVIMVVPGAVLIGRRRPVLSPDASSQSPSDADETGSVEYRVESRLAPMLNQINQAVERYPGRLALIAGVLVTFALAGFFRLRVETDFSKNFRDESPIVTSLQFFERRLGGAGTWEVNFPAPEKLDEEYLERVRTLTARLREMKAEDLGSAESVDLSAYDGKLRKVVSLTDALDLIPKRVIFEIPLETRIGTLRRNQKEFLSGVYNAEEQRMRIVLRAQEQQDAGHKNELIANVESLAREEFPDAEVKPVATGIFVLLAFLIDSLLSDQVLSFSLAAAGVVTVMTIAFRSLRIGLISLVPNLFPIVMVIGTMGWLGFPINIATAMIASVSMGLTVDNSIHFLNCFQRAQSNGKSVQAALLEAHQTVGKALVFSNLALIAGFSVLTLSHFIPLVYFGILVSVAMFGGLVGNLVLLPLLLQFTVRDRGNGPAPAET